MEFNGMINSKELFVKHHSEYLKFELVVDKKSNRPDLNAFILLDKLCPSSSDMITSSTHDEIFIDVDTDDLNKVATEADIIELIRCGVRLSSEFDTLTMFT